MIALQIREVVGGRHRCNYSTKSLRVSCSATHFHQHLIIDGTSKLSVCDIFLIILQSAASRIIKFSPKLGRKTCVLLGVSVMRITNSPIRRSLFFRLQIVFIVDSFFVLLVSSYSWLIHHYHYHHHHQIVACTCRDGMSHLVYDKHIL